MNYPPKFKSRAFSLNCQYVVALNGGTLQTILTSLADSERAFRRASLKSLADNAAEAYKTILRTVELNQ